MVKYIDPVGSALKVQKIAISIWSGSLMAMLITIFALDPSVSIGYIYIFLFFLFIFISSGLALFAFWWNYYLLKRLLQMYDIYRLITQSVETAAFIVVALVLFQTQVFGFWMMIIFTITYGMFYLWHNSNED